MSRADRPHQEDSQRFLERKAYYSQFLTIYGRNAVLEALEEPSVRVAKLHLAEGSKGKTVQRILTLAEEQGAEINRTTRERVTRISRNGRQDQGVAADLKLEHYQDLTAFLGERDGPCRLMLLDGITTPANVGMIIRSCCAAGMDGVIIPEKGCASIGPMVIKASAGTAFGASLLRAPSAREAAGLCRNGGIAVVALTGEKAEDLFSVDLPPRVVYVLGAEGDGVSRSVLAEADYRLRIPMAPGVESLNVAVAASLVAYQGFLKCLSTSS
ncbi:MAG: TrmH family RNA methyltransferase [Planctomycetota bacterium]|jgi:23S rRNA (guanosine2251-2'-O)-methyltransferase